MRITFILPFSGQKPVGGFKVVYEYASGLAQRGHTVTVVHPARLRIDETRPAQIAMGLVKYLARRAGVKGGYRPDPWFDLDPRVRAVWTPSLFERWIPEGDVVIATAWETAEWVAAYPASRGRKFHLIQHLETCMEGADPDRVMKTWKLPMKKIVIAKWLLEAAIGLGESAVYIPNGLDFQDFGLDAPIADRDPHHLIMLYHNQKWKGAADGMEAMRRAKKEAPPLSAVLFGVPGGPADLPDWIVYHQSPTQKQLRALYNHAAVYVGPSWVEGWGLTATEAMQCGAAACLTDNGGHREFAIDGETALLSPPKDPEAMAQNILRLVRDPDLRTGIATRGHAYVQRFTWERALDALESRLKQAL